MFFITFNKEYHPEDNEELLEWFAGVINPKAEEPSSSEPKADEQTGAQPEPSERQEQAAKIEEVAGNEEAVKKGEPAKGIPGHRWATCLADHTAVLLCEVGAYSERPHKCHAEIFWSSHQHWTSTSVLSGTSWPPTMVWHL